MCCEGDTAYGESVVKQAYTEGLQPMASTHTGRDKKCEEQRRADGVTVSPIHHLLLLVGRRKSSLE